MAPFYLFLVKYFYRKIISVIVSLFYLETKSTMSVVILNFSDIISLISAVLVNVLISPTAEIKYGDRYV